MPTNADILIPATCPCHGCNEPVVRAGCRTALVLPEMIRISTALSGLCFSMAVRDSFLALRSSICPEIAADAAYDKGPG